MGIVEAAGHGQAEVDDTVAILEQRDREFQRQMHRIGTFNLVPELQLIDDDMVVGRELAVLHQVGEIRG